MNEENTKVFVLVLSGDRCGDRAVPDQLGGIHLEPVGELEQRGHARLDLVVLDPGDRRRGDAGAFGQLACSRSVPTVTAPRAGVLRVPGSIREKSCVRELLGEPVHEFYVRAAYNRCVGLEALDLYGGKR